MDRDQFYRNELLYEGDLMGSFREAYRALGLFAADVLGVGNSVGGFPCTATGPAGLSVNLGPGRIYANKTLDDTPMGQIGGTGGMAADTSTDHMIVKMGKMIDTWNTGMITPPVTAGQSQVFLIQVQYQQADDAATLLQFWNPANPLAPTSASLSPARRDIAIASIKAGAAATTGTQVAPSADAGWIGLYDITVANGATTIVAGNITVHAAAPFINIGSGGSAVAAPWQNIASAYTAFSGDKLIVDTSGSAFAIAMPPVPVSDSSTVRIKGDFATHNLTLNGNGHNFDFGSLGNSTPYTLNKDGLDVMLVFDGTNWRI